MADTTAPDDTLQRMGELVRTIRQLAASELALRTALEEIARRGCSLVTVAGVACAELYGDPWRPSWCAACIATTALAGES